MSNDLVITKQIATIDIDDDGVSIFAETEYELNHRCGMFLSERINASNFRLRQSDQAYSADWHVAGDPTLIIILVGGLRIKLRNGDYRDFISGEMFIAKDRLMSGQVFDGVRHGHSAEVIGDVALNAIHIKLAKLGD